MSIEYEPIPPVPTQTIRVAKAAFPKGNPYLTLRDELGPIFSDLDESRFVLQDGKTCGAPLAVGVGHKKCNTSENLSDRQAADAVRARIDCPYLLGLELTDCGFDFSVLSEFRHRLIAGQAEHLLLEQLLAHCCNFGLVI